MAANLKAKKLWLTYAWVDNEDFDIDHIVAELEKVGLQVNLDRRQLVPGQRLWPQIDQAISDPATTDAWAIFATENSLMSEPCLEELSYALDRALRCRGSAFPIIGIFPKPIDRKHIPSALATRLYVNLNSRDWVDQIVAGVQQLPLSDPVTSIEPFVYRAHKLPNQIVLEIRPRSGRWYPCTIAVPTQEITILQSIIVSPEGRPPLGGMTTSSEFNTPDGNWKGRTISHSVDTLNSI